MAIDVRLENESGQVLAELRDPDGRLNWLLSLADFEQSECLKSIRPYGEVVVSAEHLGVLRRELQALSCRVTKDRVELVKAEYRDSAAAWPARAREDALRYVGSFSRACGGTT